MDYSELEQKIKQLNAGLKRVSIERYGDRLGLRASLPAKPHIQKQGYYQQRIYLGIAASDLNLQIFKWEDWLSLSHKSFKRKLVKDYLEEFESDHWSRIEQTEQALTTWKTGYQRTFKKLDATAEMSVETLLDAIHTTKPNTNTRKKVCIYLNKLAEFAGMSEDERLRIRRLVGKYSASSVNPRSLPTDNQILEYRASIKQPGWQWLFGIIAAYGLRSHEAFHLDVLEFPKVRVLQGKTGSRFVLPYHPSWATDWKLHDIIYPPLQSIENSNHAKLSTKVSGWFSDRRSKFGALDLRHCYARRCFEYRLDATVAAKFMGHKLSVHLDTYSAWFDEEVYSKAYAQTLCSDTVLKLN
jgi:hypothetical protein